MSRYKAYPEYRESGLEWLGAIPSHWKISPLKYLARFSGGGTPSKDNPDFWNGDIPWVSPKDMKVRKVVATIDNVTELAIKQSSTNLLEKGALLMVVRSGILQHSIPVAINEVPVSLNQDMKALRFADPLLSEYAYYFVTGNQSSLLLEWSKEGATVESIEHEYLASTLFPCPPLKDRTTIIKFLDHETAKIDALIEKQQRLIELLKEKRQAVISQAVTKGLNPNAPMKDSGVEWLGEVPAHWTVKKLGYLANKIGSGKTPKGGSEIYQDDGVLFLRSQNIYDSGLRLDPVDCVYISNSIHEEMAGTKVLAGDVLLNITGGSIGRSCLVPAGFFTANVNQHVCILRFPSGANEFLAFLIKSQAIQAQIDACQTGGNREGLNFEQISKMAICLPPNDEQTQLVEHLNTSTKKFDHLELTALQTVAFLQERRTALISAAVTGKIDVRDWQAAA